MVTLRRSMTLTSASLYDVVMRVRGELTVDIWEDPHMRKSGLDSYQQLVRLDRIFPGINIGVLDKR